MRSNRSTDDRGRLIYAVAFIALAVFAVFLIATAVNASDDSDADVNDTFTTGGISYKVLTESGTTGTVSVEQNFGTDGKNKYTGTIIIPEYVNWTVSSTTYTYTVVKLGDNAFKDCSRLDAVIVPKTVTTFGTDSAKSHTLADLVIRKSDAVCSLVTSSSFAYLTTKIHVVESILDDYQDDTNWDSFERQLVSYKLYKDDNNNEYYVFNSTLHIDDGASGTGVLGNFSALNVKTKLGITETFTSVSFDEGVISIGEGIFYNSSDITSISMDDSVTTIGDNAFYRCEYVTKVAMSNSLTTIGNGSFSGCSGLEQITIPSTVTSIGNSAFAGCSLLAGQASDIRIHIMPTTVPTLGTNAFPADSYMDLPNDTVSAYTAATNWGDYSSKFNEASASTYKVSYEKNYRNLSYGQKSTTFSELTAKSGYRFMGLFEKENGQGVQYVSYDYRLIHVWDRTADTTLYAYWAPIKVGVMFKFYDSGQKAYVDLGCAIATKGSSVLTNFLPALDKPGYTLGGYYTSTSSGYLVINTAGELQAGVSNYTDSSGNWIWVSTYRDYVDLYCQWTAITYSITLPDESDRIGYTITASKTTGIKVTDSVTVTLNLTDGYKGSTPVVCSNDEVLTGTKSGYKYTYALKDIAVDILITVSGIELDTPSIHVQNATLEEDVYTANYSATGIKLSAVYYVSTTRLNYPAGTEFTWYLDAEETEDEGSDIYVKNVVTNAHYGLSVTLNGVTKSCTSNVTLTINKKDLTATAKNTTIYYGDAAANNGLSFSGFVEGESETKSDLQGTASYAYTYDTTVADKRKVGTYTITPSGLTSNNYNIIFKDGTLTVSKAILTITANDDAITYGDGAPGYGVTYEGLKYSETSSVVSGLTITCSYDQADPSCRGVGTYDIVPSGATATSYTPSYVNGTLTVDQKELVISASKNVTYSGESTYVTEDFSTGVYEEALDLTYTPSSKNVGTYVFGAQENGFTITYLGDQNYSFTSAGDLVIAKKDVGVIGWEAPKDLVYSGKAKEPVPTLDGICGTDVCKATITLKSGNNVNAGKFTMITTGLDNGNYNLPVNSESDEYTITKATPTSAYFNVTMPSNLVYDGSKKEVSVTVKDGFTGMGKFTVLYSDNVNVGTCSVSLSAEEGDNFTVAENVSLGSFEITAAPAPPADNTGLIVGIIIGVVAALVVIGVVVVIYLRKNFYF